MLCKCVENGQARVVRGNKITWFEKGMVGDILIDPKVGIPDHFVAVDMQIKEDKKTKKFVKDDLADV